MAVKSLRIISLLAWLIVAFPSLAQRTCHLSGNVTISPDTAAKEGIVTLYRSPDSALLKTAIINAGLFDLGMVDTGLYFVVAAGSFTTLSTSFAISSDTVITLYAEAKQGQLKEVEVTAYKNPFSYSHGNIKAKVEGTVLATHQEAIEILSKLPTVQVSSDREQVSIIGRGSPLIYLNNQRITLNELNALSVSDIASIEIINHPPASYEADGRAVILVARKVNNKRGAKADLSEALSQKRFTENRAGINASIKNNKTEWKASLNYNYARRFEGLIGILNSDAYNYQSNYNGTSTGPRNQYLYTMGMYHQLKDGGYFQVGISGRIQKENASSNTYSFIQQDNTSSSAFTKNWSNSNRPFGNVSFNYLKKLKHINSQLFVGGQYSQYRLNNKTTITNKFSNDSNFQVSELRRQDFLVNVGVARADFKKKFTNDVTWESGVNVSVSRSNSIFDINYVSAATKLASNYDYNEDNAAAYTQLSGTKNKLSYQAGLRVESTIIDGRFKDSSRALLSRNFTYLFPHLDLSLPIDSQREISLSLARNIRRPNYSNANQVSNYITPFLEWANNINIYPQLTSEISLNYRYRNYNIGVTAFSTSNPSWYVTRYDSTLQKVRMVNTNLRRMNGANVQLTAPFSYKRLTSNNVVVVQWEDVIDEHAVHVPSQPYFYLYSSNQLQLPKGCTFTATAWITTPQNQGIFHRQQQYSVDFSLSRIFFKKLTCTINAFDIFRSLNYVEHYNFNGIYNSATFLENQKEYSISLKYSIGKLKDANYKSREVNENSNRLN